MLRTVDTSWGKYLSFCLQITNTADCIPTQRCSMLIILSCLLHSALPLYPLPRHDLNTALLIWMTGFVSTVYVIILANPRLSCLVHVSIYCHFRLSPVPIASFLSSNCHWSGHNPWHQTFHLWPSCFSTLPEIFFLSLHHEAHTLLSYRQHSCIHSKDNGSILPRLLQLLAV